MSLAAQETKLRAYAVAMDVELVDVTVEQASAKDLACPGLQRALAMLDAGDVQGMLVAKLDRLTRSVRDLGNLIADYFASRFQLLSVADSIDTRTAAGRLVLNVLASVGQREREVISERTKDALQVLKSRGVKLGRSPVSIDVARAAGLLSEGRTQAETALALGVSVPTLRKALRAA